MSILRRLDRREFECDFLVREDTPGSLDEEVRGIGARILRCNHRSGVLAYIRKLAELLRTQGPYDVLHCHTHFFDGVLLPVAAAMGVPVRISHSHASLDGRAGSCARRLQRALLKCGIRIAATHRVGVSEASYLALFGKRCQHTAESRIIRNGIELGQAGNSNVRGEIRRELGISDSARVLGHVGRFDDGKNHSFLLSCFHELLEKDDRWRMILVGDGELRERTIARAYEIGVRQYIVDLGVRSDVDRLLPAMDVFAFPSKHEGLGMALLEAQSRGLPCVASTAVPREADIGLNLITFLDLAGGPRTWADSISDIRNPNLAESACRQAVKASGFEIDSSLGEWISLYRAGERNH